MTKTLKHLLKDLIGIEDVPDTLQALFENPTRYCQDPETLDRLLALQIILDLPESEVFSDDPTRTNTLY